MKKVKRMESLKGYALDAQSTSKLDGGYLETGGGCHENRVTWVSDAIYSEEMGDSQNKTLYYSDVNRDVCMVNLGGDITTVATEFKFVGVLDKYAGPMLNIDQYSVSASLVQELC